MAKYQAYPEYKDSGVEWLGDIPTDWTVTALKNISKIINGSTPKSGVESYWDGLINWMTPTDLSQKSGCHVSDSLRKITLSGLESCGTTLVPANTIILSTRAPIGSIAIGTSEFCTNQGCKSIVISDVLISNFIYYLLSTLTLPLNNLGRGSTFLELSSDDLGSVKVSLPKENIKNILDFLDYETTKIDSLIEKQQKLIELLKEKRQAVISHAVTKGLNPDVPMKDSGVVWLGAVPEHWHISKFGHISSVVRGGSPRPAGDPTLFDGDFSPWVTVAEITKDANVYLNSTETFLTKKGSEQCRVFKTGTLLISNSGATLGVPKILGVDANANDGVVGFESLKLNLEYSYYYLSTLTNNLRESIKQGSGQPNLNTDIVKNIYVPIPPQDEVNDIVSFIKVNVSIYSDIELKSEQQIKLLQERRTALISAAVTGKIDVRNWVAPATSEAAADTASQEVNA